MIVVGHDGFGEAEGFVGIGHAATEGKGGLAQPLVKRSEGAIPESGEIGGLLGGGTLGERSKAISDGPGTMPVGEGGLGLGDAFLGGGVKGIVAIAENGLHVEVG